MHPPDILHRLSLRGALEHAHNLGLAPRAVIDVGVAYGTPELYEVFPDAHHLLIEPLDVFRPYLERIVASCAHADYVIAAATRQPGSVTLHVHPDLTGSSLYVETEQSPGVNGVPRVVPSVTLDEVCSERRIAGPYLIKVDVQGAELDVLAGAETVLRDTDYAVVETSLFQFYRHGVQLFDVMSFLRERGFAVYDVVGPLYRPLDGALAQLDVAFVRESSRFRASHAFATPAQRQVVTEQLGSIRPADGAHA